MADSSFLVARVLGGGAEAPWTVKTLPARVEPEVYTTLPRKVRRALRHEQRQPMEASALDHRPARFTDEAPRRAVLDTLMWWNRPFRVGAHIFSACPRLFREWAGQDFRRIRTGSLRQAFRHTDGLCNYCLFSWEMGVSA